MNLQFKTFILAVIAVLVFSCKKKESEQIKLQPDELVGAFVDTDFEFEAYSVLKDSTISGNSYITRLLAGTVESETFGSLSSSAYTQLVIPENGFEIDPGAKNISVNLILSKNYFYGEFNEQLKYLIYELGEDLSTSDVYYSNSNIRLGSFLQEINISSNDAIYTIPLDNVFKKKILDLSGVINNQRELNEIFKGISIQSTGSNSLLGFSLSDSKIEVSYEVTNTNGVVDTVSHDFLLGSGIAHFNKVKTEMNGTSFQNLTNYGDEISTISMDNKILIQSSSRVEAVLKFNTLNEKLFRTKQHIYKAELEVKLNQDPFVKLNESNAVLLDVYNSSDSLITVIADEINSQGVVNYDITESIQEVIAGNLEIGNLNLYTSFVGSRGLTVWMDNPQENVKLKIYFKED